MPRDRLLRLAMAALLSSFIPACSGGSAASGGSGGASASGGVTGSGGSGGTASGGTTGSGGHASGGMTGAGGASSGGSGTGGASGSGGHPSGGAAGPGGGSVTGSGGTTGSGGHGGQPGTGGRAGTGGQAGGGHGGGAGGRGGASFADVLSIFQERCVTCHDATKQGLPAYPSLSLTSGDAYAALVGHPADETCGGTRVVAGDPASSYLIHKVSEDTPCDGARMPARYEVLPATPLTSDEIATLTSWIAAGAPH